MSEQAGNRQSLSSGEARKPGLVIVASPRARTEPTSPLLRLVRDHSRVLKEYKIHATAETARTILGTGIYDHNEVKKHRAGSEGGIAQVAALVARRECVAAILLLDPSDPWSDAVENRALTRVCIQRHIRLMTTYVAALRWATFEARFGATPPKTPEDSIGDWRPSNWRVGIRNATDDHQFKRLPIQQRSIALISHDKKKIEMVEFLNDKDHLELLAQHDRILATGTTGWLLKLLFCSDPNAFKVEVEKLRLEKRLCAVMADIFRGRNQLIDLGFDKMLKILRIELATKPNDAFAEKVMPLPSGPDGGDVLAADQVLDNACHAIIFFHDPTTAHPHNDDIRLLERTCRLPGVFAECVSDKHSAYKWIEGLGKENAIAGQLPSFEERLRQEYGLKEVILVETDNNQDSDQLGSALARACGGFLNQWLYSIGHDRRHVRIGVAWGWGMRQVIKELERLEDNGMLQKPASLPEDLFWSPIIGITTATMTDREANAIADAFRNFYGGKFEGFGFAGFAARAAGLPNDVAEHIARLRTSELVLTSSSSWDEDNSLAKNTAIDRSKLPGFSDAVGTISGVFLNAEGHEVQGEYQIVGLGYDGLRRVAQNGEVVLICGGDKRNPVALAALRGRLVSVLVTTRQTADWVLQQATA